MTPRQPFSLLFSSDFESLGFIAGSDESLYAALGSSLAVNEIRESLRSGALAEKEIRSFAEHEIGIIEEESEDS